MDLNSIFDGIGTEIISIIVGLIIGSFGGYKVGIKKQIKQNQEAVDYSEQTQYGLVEKESKENDTKVAKDIKIEQKQKAGERAKQIQIGSK